MIRDIVLWPDNRLHATSAPVEIKTDESGAPFAVKYDLKALVADLFETMYAAGGIGLSAVQVGVPLRVFVMEAEPGVERVFVNPENIKLDGVPEERNEGCLSVPGVTELVMRYPTVTIKALDRDLKPFESTFTGIEGQVIQHEYDHLQGIVMPDKLSATARERLRKLVLRDRGK